MPRDPGKLRRLPDRAQLVVGRKTSGGRTPLYLETPDGIEWPTPVAVAGNLPWAERLAEAYNREAWTMRQHHRGCPCRKLACACRCHESRKRRLNLHLLFFKGKESPVPIGPFDLPHGSKVVFTTHPTDAAGNTVPDTLTWTSSDSATLALNVSTDTLGAEGVRVIDPTSPVTVTVTATDIFGNSESATVNVLPPPVPAAAINLSGTVEPA